MTIDYEELCELICYKTGFEMHDDGRPATRDQILMLAIDCGVY